MPMVKEAQLGVKECFNLGTRLEQQERVQEAEGFFRKAVQLSPTDVDLHLLLANVLLKQGKLDTGFQEYEWRKQKKVEDFTWFAKKPSWTGEIFSNKTLLVHSEQGLGDSLQFARYFPLVKARGGKVVFLTRHPLVRLFKTCAGIDEILDEQVTISDFDLSVSLMSLPKIFGTSLNTIPQVFPYVTPDQQDIHRWQDIIGTSSQKKVGLVWSGNNGGYLTNRSATLAEFGGLATVPGTLFYSLQKGEGAEQLKSSPQDMQIIDLAPQLEDFADTAAAMASLDLIISIDTSVPHLAGAMGKEVWVLLPFNAEWRWLTERENSPWYPTMRLFRQREPGNWAEVINRVAKELHAKY